jgi:hypothetical protein
MGQHRGMYSTSECYLQLPAPELLSEVVRPITSAPPQQVQPGLRYAAGTPVTSCVHSNMRAWPKPETLIGCRTGTWTRRRRLGSTTSGC